MSIGIMWAVIENDFLSVAPPVSRKDANTYIGNFRKMATAVNNLMQ